MTGGYTGDRRLASTEILARRDEGARWTEAGALPVASTGLRAVSLQNKILVTGNKQLAGKIILQNLYNTIWRWPSF